MCFIHYLISDSDLVSRTHTMDSFYFLGFLCFFFFPSPHILQPSSVLLGMEPHLDGEICTITIFMVISTVKRFSSPSHWAPSQLFHNPLPLAAKV